MNGTPAKAGGEGKTLAGGGGAGPRSEGLGIKQRTHVLCPEVMHLYEDL